MLVRVAKPGDSAAIRRVHRAAIQGFGPSAYSDEQVAAWAAGCDTADYTAAITDASMYYVVAERDGGVVAFGSLNHDVSTDEYVGPVEAEVTAVYVHPDAGGQGVGSAVYVELEAVAMEHDETVLGLWSSLNAVGFYERKGFEAVRRFEHEFSSALDTGVTGTVVEMQKNLSDAG